MHAHEYVRHDDKAASRLAPYGDDGRRPLKPERGENAGARSWSNGRKPRSSGRKRASSLGLLEKVGWYGMRAESTGSRRRDRRVTRPIATKVKPSKT
jgi:hypothetical protein